jgi:hypothetical protein
MALDLRGMGMGCLQEGPLLMADKDLRKAERNDWAESTPDSRARILGEQMRTGQISWERLCLQAFLGDQPSRLVTSTTTQCVAGGHSETCLTEWGDLCPWMYMWADARDHARALIWLVEASGFDGQRTAVIVYQYVLKAFDYAVSSTFTEAQLRRVRARIAYTEQWLAGTSKGAHPADHVSVLLEGTALPRWADIGRLTWSKTHWSTAFPDLIEDAALVVSQALVKELVTLAMCEHVLPRTEAA